MSIKDRTDQFGRVWLSDVKKDKEKYGPLFANFYQKRAMLDSISAQGQLVAKEIEQCALDGRFDDLDYVVTRFFDAVEKAKKDFEYVERRRDER